MTEQRARGGVTPSGALSLAAGVVVFAAFVWKVGPAEIWNGILSVGWMFPVIIALGGLRFLARASAWSICAEPPHRLRVGNAFSAALAGDAIGNATPLGPVAGEPAKAALVRANVPLHAALTALAIENIFYTLSTAAMIAAGTMALLFAFDLPPTLREFSEIAVAAIVALFLVSLVLLWRQPALISRWLPLMSRPGTKLHNSIGRVRALEQEIYTFASRRRAAVLPVIVLEVSFHALSVLETHLTMWMILGYQPPVIQSFILETANRVITVAFKFIPFQLGVGEVGAGFVTNLLGLGGTTSGAALAVVRKARMGAWALVGGAILLRGR